VKEKASDRDVEFIITSNLAFLTDEILIFAKEHQMKFSCSLDGPTSVHNTNRPRPGTDSYERTIAGINRIREALGHDAVSALMTTTAESLRQPELIIDEYVKQGFHSIFLRWISPFGFALKSAQRIGYDTEDFLKFYKAGLGHILNLNVAGTPFREDYAAIILRKILTPFQTAYVDLQSPSGLGLSVLVYNYDGDLYASDEARMLAEMGDKTFCLGNLHKKTYEELFLDSPLLEVIWDTVLEGIPGCNDCAFSPYCGTDPVYNHATQRDVIGHRPTSSFCRRNMEIIRHLFTILEENSERSRILRFWAQ
jgi:His-Xaa-Ser system radical SAM maturase HxsB